jgi:hypothetical protein
VRCATGQLTLAEDPELISEKTGQRTALFDLTNHGATACFLDGYPGVSLLGASGRVLPLQSVSHGDQMVTPAKPHRVDLSPGATAYFAVNQYRCDTTDLAQATAIRVYPPDNTASLTSPLRPDGRTLSYCGPGDPGSVLAVSPIEDTPTTTL